MTTMSILYFTFCVKEPLERKVSKFSELELMNLQSKLFLWNVGERIQRCWSYQLFEKSQRFSHPTTFGHEKAVSEEEVIDTEITHCITTLHLFMLYFHLLGNLLLQQFSKEPHIQVTAFQTTSSGLYLYMIKVFENFGADEFAYFSAVISLCNAFFLMIFMPIVSGSLQMTDTLLLTLISVIECLSYILPPYMKNIWLFYGTQVLNSIAYCKYSLGRSLLSKVCFLKVEFLTHAFSKYPPPHPRDPWLKG